jgi:DNA sulfur modification protein DndD
MIFDSVVLNNFGAYLGRHEIDLTVSRDRPIILIGALNGSGKTTLLDAMQLALYGKNAKCSGRDRIGYTDYLASMINRNAPPHQGASVEFNFRTRHGGKDTQMRLVRTWSKRGATVKESFEVYRGAALDSVASERWVEFVEEFMPAKMADLFFFDGEKIEALADPVTASDLLREGVHTLLGIDLVEDLKTSLLQVERKRKVDAVSVNEKEELFRLEAEYADLQRAIGDRSQARAGVQNTIDDLDKREAAATDAFKRSGGELVAKRDALIERRDLLTDRRGELEDELRTLAAGILPLSVANELLGETLNKANQVRVGKQAKMLRSEAESRDGEIENFILTAGVTPSVGSQVRAFLQADRERRYLVTEGLDAFPDSLLDQFSYQALEAAKERLAKVSTDHKDCVERLSELERNLTAIPSIEALQPILKQLEQCRRERIECDTTLRATDEELRSLRYKADRVKGQATREAERLGERLTRDQVSARVISHSARARQMLQTFGQLLLSENLHKLEDAILERYRILLRKKSLVKGIVIDPDTFQILLSSSDGHLVPADRLSAGERQLLAVATLWGLSRESGRKLPTVIDTPLSRLDSLHRSALVRSYFPKAGSQVILLSTDEEIVGRYSEMLAPYVAKHYTIVHDEGNKTSRFENEYFSSEALA